MENQKVNDLQINEEFRSLIPPLTNEQFKMLEKSVKEEGCRDAIVIWNGVIVDGYNRYQICRDNNIKYQIREIEFPDEEAVKNWIYDNQLGRRNLTDDQRKIIIGRIYNSCKKAPHRPQGTKKGAKSAPLKTAEITANEYNLSPRTVKAYGKIADHFDNLLHEHPDRADKIWKGEERLVNRKKVINRSALEKNQEDSGGQNDLNIPGPNPTICQQDCNDFLNTLADKSVDLIITEPPSSKEDSNFVESTSKWIKIATEKLKPTGRIYIFLNPLPSDLPVYIGSLNQYEDYVIDHPLIHPTIGKATGTKNGYICNYQMILHIYRKESSPLNVNNKNESLSLQQESADLAERFIRHSTTDGNLVIDCFAGKGTFLIAAAKIGRIAKGCEKNEKIVKQAENLGCSVEK